MNKNKLFITGGNGFIGKYLIRNLLNSKYKIIATTQNNSRYKLLEHNNLKWINKPLKNIQKEDFEDAYSLIHLASHKTYPPYDALSKYLETNCIDTIRMIELAAQNGISKFLIAGSAFEYGKSADYYKFIPTDAPLLPLGSYPTSKVISFYALKELANELKIDISYQRIFQVFGEGENERRFWPSLKKAALAGKDFPMTTGNQIRDFINVEEVSSQLLEAFDDLFKQEQNFNTGHIAKGYGQTLKEFAEYWWKVFKAKGELKPGLIKSRGTDLKRIVAKK